MSSRCSRCRSPVTDATVRLEVVLEGRTFTATATGSPCERCGHDGVAPDVHARFKLLVASRGIDRPSGEGLKFMREALDLRAADLAGMLDVSPETLSRWENGRREIPRASFTVVLAMTRDALEGRTSTQELLRSLAHESRKPERVALGSLMPQRRANR